MTDFGDFDDADAFDIEPADPEQVARKLHELRDDYGLEDRLWPDLEPAQRLALIAIAGRLLSWLRRQGSA